MSRLIADYYSADDLVIQRRPATGVEFSSCFYIIYWGVQKAIMVMVGWRDDEINC
ncbi:hypothetical protein ABKV19_017201 [Rosa sericea]